MNQRSLKHISDSSSGKEGQQRLTVKRFFDLLCPHIEAIRSAQETLKEHIYLFTSEDCVMFDECEEMIDYLIDLSVIYHRFQAIIKQSDMLPLAVVPIRLTLLTTLIDADAQTSTLKGLLVGLSETSRIDIFQSPKQLYEIECEFSTLQKQNDHILDQVRIFADNARFKEREYSLV